MLSLRLHSVLELRSSGGPRGGTSLLLLEFDFRDATDRVILVDLGFIGWAVAVSFHGLLVLVVISISFYGYVVLSGSDWPHLCWEQREVVHVCPIGGT